MKIRNSFLLLFLTSCISQTEQSIEGQSDIIDLKTKSVPKLEISTENFNEFLLQWNIDSAFQISRIKFPLNQDILDPHDDGYALLIYEDSTDWIMHLNLEYKYEYHDGIGLEFKQDTIYDENIITIQQRGDYSKPETKWHIDYTFTLLNKKWYLTSTADFSY